jgi:peptidoglycan/LPS O-acetylase OafA/YrhL
LFYQLLNNAAMFTLQKRTTTIVLIVAFLLLIPLVAMQFTNEVNWTLFDFIVAGFLLLGTGLLFEFASRKVRNPTYRIAICLTILTTLVLIWLELAVGIFGTPFAGQ